MLFDSNLICKKGLIHSSNFPTLTKHNSACSWAIASKFCAMNFTTLDNTVTKCELNYFTTHWVMGFNSCNIGCMCKISFHKSSHKMYCHYDTGTYRVVVLIPFVIW